MFRCQLCGGTQPSGTRSHRVVTRIRQKTYLFRHDANEVSGWVNGKHKTWQTDDPGGAGWEASAEVLACGSCARAHVPKRE